MKSLVKFLVVAVVLFAGARYFAQSKANAMVDLASSMARDGRYDDALKELDAVQSWFSWTSAAGRVEEERKVIRQKMAARDQAAEWDRQSADEERERKRQEAHDRALERIRAGGTPQIPPSQDRDSGN